MQLLLMGLGGCSGIDISMILGKQRQVMDSFSRFRVAILVKPSCADVVGA